MRNLAWWLEDEPEAQMVNEAVAQAAHRYEPTHDRWLMCLRAYTGRPILSLSHGDYMLTDPELIELEEDARLNVVQSLVETMLSKTTRNRTRTVFKPEGADPEQAERARQLGKFCAGINDFNRLRQRSELMTIDALVCGVGIARTFWVPKGRRADIVTRRAVPWSVFYDQAEAYDGEAPCTIYHVRLVDRQRLMQRYPKLAEQLEVEPRKVSLGLTAATSDQSESTHMDTLRVVEGWHLGPKGRYVCVTGEHVLESRSWKGENFPFAAMAWQLPPQGWWLESRGLAETALPLQRRLDKITAQIDNAFDTAPKFVWNDAASGIPNEQIAATLNGYRVMTGSGNPPVIVSSSPIHPSYMGREGQYLQWLYELSGVSQAAAMARKPAGIESAIGLQTLEDQHAERFLSWHARYSDFFVQVDLCQIEAAREAAAAGYAVEASPEGESKVKWADVKLEADQFVIKVEAISNLPKTFAGQVEAAQALINTGALPRDKALRLVTDLPDLETETNLQMALQVAVERDVAAIMAGEERVPSTLDDNNYAVDYSRKMYALHKADMTAEARNRLWAYYEAARENAAAEANATANAMAAAAPPQMQAPAETPIATAGPLGSVAG